MSYLLSYFGSVRASKKKVQSHSKKIVTGNLKLEKNQFKDISFRMTRESIISGITDILNLSKVGIVPPSVFISGSVGSGKTFLLHECLEKTDVDFGTIRSGEIYSSRLLVDAFLNAVKGF